MPDPLRRRPPTPPAGRPRVAALTMVRDEAVMLPRWVEHYSRQCGGPGALLVIDDNSTDGSTDDLDCPVLRIPSFVHRPFEPARMGFVSHVASALLESYDAVIFCDADEFLVAEPERYDTLADLVGAKPTTKVFGSIGLNVVHHVGAEPDLDPSAPISEQRHLAKFIPLMCKPAMKKVHGAWTSASHGLKNTEWAIDPELWLFHAKFADREALRIAAESRLTSVLTDNRPRTTSWKFSGDRMVKILDKMTADLPEDDPYAGIPEFEPTTHQLRRVVVQEDDTWRARGGGRQIQRMRKGELVRIPDRFRGTF
jgi:hypothetical protein